jgi:hypothetical protein
MYIYVLNPLHILNPLLGILENCSLNLCVTDGHHIIVSRFRGGAHSQPPSLYYNFGSDFVCEEGQFYAKVFKPLCYCVYLTPFLYMYEPLMIHIYVYSPLYKCEPPPTIL